MIKRIVFVVYLKVLCWAFNLRTFRRLRLEAGYYYPKAYMRFLRDVVGSRLSQYYDNKIGVFGSGEHTKLLFDSVPALADRVGCVLDNDPTRWGKTIYGKDIVPPKDAVDDCAVIFLSSIAFQNAMESQLKQLGFRGIILRPDDSVPHGYLSSCRDR